MKKYIVLFICLFLLSIFFFLSNVRQILVYQSEKIPLQADAIIVLGGGDGSRIKKAVAYYNESNSKIMIMTAGPTLDISYAKLMKDYAVKLGIPESSIVLEEKSLSTKDHPNYLISIFKQYDISTIVIVTSMFHTRRSYLTFNKVLENSNIEVYILGAPDKIDYKRWFKNHEDSEKVFLELLKLFVYKIFYL